MNSAERVEFVFVSAAIFIYLLSIAPDGASLLLDSDAGHQLAKANLVLHGLHPFVDYEGHVYGPLIFYLSALAQWLTGHRAVGEFGLDLAGFLIGYCLYYRILKKTVGSRLLGVSALVLLVLLIPKFYKYYIIICAALIAACVYLVSRYPANRRTYAAVGIILGACTLLRLDFGLYGLISVFAAILYAGYLGHLPSPARPVGEVCLVLFMTLLPWLLFLCILDNPIRILTETLSDVSQIRTGLALPSPSVWPESALSFTSEAMFGPLYWLCYAAPALSLVLLFSPLARRLDASDKVFLFSMSVLALLVFRLATYRSDVAHLRQAIPTVFVLGVVWVDRILAMIGPGRGPAAGSILVAGMLFIVLYPFLTFPSASAAESPGRYYSEKVGGWSRTREELMLENDSTYMPRLLGYIQSATRPQDCILVIPIGWHVYYFADRGFGVGPVLRPGLSVRQQQDFVAGLSGTSVIVYFPNFSFNGEKSGRAEYFAPAVIDFIHRNYSLDFRTGPIEVLRAKRLSSAPLYEGRGICGGTR